MKIISLSETDGIWRVVAEFEDGVKVKKTERDLVVRLELDKRGRIEKILGWPDDYLIENEAGWTPCDGICTECGAEVRRELLMVLEWRCEKCHDKYIEKCYADLYGAGPIIANSAKGIWAQISRLIGLK